MMSKEDRAVYSLGKIEMLIQTYVPEEYLLLATECLEDVYKELRDRAREK